MSATEAWLVTLLGVGVVFFGLVLCILFINLFSRLARRITWDGAHGANAPTEAPAPEPTRFAPPEPPGPEILAVIAAVLEVERRLYQGRPGQRLTIAR
jgi:Na+-transporting methylmalonyl-CoA/oxaloacetate decarboxylase gamma subunit